ncbi:MAG: hypothetical protein ACQEW8_02025 [Actinomycetota bacterium]
MASQRSTTRLWWALCLCTAYCIVVIVMILTGAVGSTLWLSVVGVGILVVSNSVNLLRIRGNRRRADESTGFSTTTAE